MSFHMTIMFYVGYASVAFLNISQFGDSFQSHPDGVVWPLPMLPVGNN